MNIVHGNLLEKAFKGEARWFGGLVINSASDVYSIELFLDGL